MRFSEDTNRANLPKTNMTKQLIDSLLVFSQSLGTDYEVSG